MAEQYRAARDIRKAVRLLDANHWKLELHDEWIEFLAAGEAQLTRTSVALRAGSGRPMGRTHCESELPSRDDEIADAERRVAESVSELVSVCGSRQTRRCKRRVDQTTFITLSIAEGRSEAWIMRRTPAPKWVNKG